MCDLHSVTDSNYTSRRHHMHKLHTVTKTHSDVVSDENKNAYCLENENWRKQQKLFYTDKKNNKMRSYRRKTALQGALGAYSFCQKWKTGTGRQYFTDIIGQSSITVIGRICRIWRKKRKIRVLRHLRSFKVIEVGTNRNLVCDVLLVISSNWHLILYRFRVIAAYCSNFGHFAFLTLSHPSGA